jgi:hypothetical protein
MGVDTDVFASSGSVTAANWKQFARILGQASNGSEQFSINDDYEDAKRAPLSNEAESLAAIKSALVDFNEQCIVSDATARELYNMIKERLGGDGRVITAKWGDGGKEWIGGAIIAEKARGGGMLVVNVLTDKP